MSIHLSIVVPLYNEEKSIEKLLTTLLEVGHSFNFDYEIIFVDDGSEDKTWEIIERLKKTTPAVTTPTENYEKMNSGLSRTFHSN